MWDEAWYQDQVEHVRSIQWDITITEIDPVVVQVYNEESDRAHDVVPESIHCSCTVHGDIDPFCDHIVALLDAEGYPGVLMREYLKERKNDLEQQKVRPKGEHHTAGEEIDEIMSLLLALDVDDMALARTHVDFRRMLIEKASDDEDLDLGPAPSPADGREVFEAMVRKVRLGDEDLDLPGEE